MPFSNPHSVFAVKNPYSQSPALGLSFLAFNNPFHRPIDKAEAPALPPSQLPK